jgi:hypothetical protein
LEIALGFFGTFLICAALARAAGVADARLAEAVDRVAAMIDVADQTRGAWRIGRDREALFAGFGQRAALAVEDARADVRVAVLSVRAR